MPELLSLDTPIVARQNSSLRRLAERADLLRLHTLESEEVPEARWLGLSPSTVRLRQGPLTVAALGADPPDHSTHFHTSLLSLSDKGVAGRATDLGAEEHREFIAAARRLNTSKLTLVPGPAADHGLVWEARGDLETTSETDLVGTSISGHLPRGDAEPLLRRYIDDSVNLLNELEFNRRRMDEGESPANLLWPWGQGLREPVPNLPLRRGEIAWVQSASLRLMGLTRLAGYRHRPLEELGSGLRTQLAKIGREIGQRRQSIVLLSAVEEFRQQGLLEEAEYWVRESLGPFLEGLVQTSELDPVELWLLAPMRDGIGLGLHASSRRALGGRFPFDERSLDEIALKLFDVESVIERALLSEPLSV